MVARCHPGSLKARNGKSLHEIHLGVALKIQPHSAVTASAPKEPTRSSQHSCSCALGSEAKAEVSLNPGAIMETDELKDMSCTQSTPRRKMMLVQTSGKQSMTPNQANTTHCYHDYRHKEVERRFYIPMSTAVPF